jgi:hypothetical protein
MRLLQIKENLRAVLSDEIDWDKEDWRENYIKDVFDLFAFARNFVVRSKLNVAIDTLDEFIESLEDDGSEI